MIHTDGRPTIANAGSLPEDRSARIENIARDLAAVYGVSLEVARAKVQQAMNPRGVSPELTDLAETLASEHPELD